MRYLVTRRVVMFMSTEVEADSKEQALDKADDDAASGNWKINDEDIHDVTITELD